MEVKVIIHDNDINLDVILPNGEERHFNQVSAMLNWCAENGYTPVIAQ